MDYIPVSTVCLQKPPRIMNLPDPTGVAAAYWAHSPVVVMTPEAATLTKGHGGFQEVDQLPLFEVRMNKV
jgi:thiamine pyrophosphate-dependent acetolactate synthase large subunit-like protein